MVETYDTIIKETIELSVWLKRLTARFEENKEKLRQYSKGEKSNFCLPGIGNILVSARRTKLLRADIITIYDKIKQEELKDLVGRKVLSVSLNQDNFSKLPQETRERLIYSRCVNEEEVKEGRIKQKVRCYPEELEPHEPEEGDSEIGEPGYELLEDQLEEWANNSYEGWPYDGDQSGNSDINFDKD